MGAESLTQQRSKLLFNNSHMLHIAAAIAGSSDSFNSLFLQEKLSLGQSTVQRTISRLEKLELVIRYPRKGAYLPLMYSKVEHSFWDTVLDIYALEFEDTE